ncbi:hypothetical protein [Methylobacterium sp. Leaf108]|uniref:hypothetical protein n=1 Tax=Methylobacterium sp. Leaf108 TaxID=1736256 RepID=UPI0006F61059|nr:hypothetical protein [Methylobacterium sp. Leaf108]KQP51327.1 hypothetical protein ASF39_09800 [Methylobacterium sp. Leaf108]
MARRNGPSIGPCTGPDAFAGAPSAGATLPFLPTLVVAAVIGLTAVCWESMPATGPSEPAATVSTSVSSDAPALPRMARLPLGAAEPSVAVLDQDRTGAVATFAAFTPLVPSVTVARVAARPVRIAAPHIAVPQIPASLGRCGGDRCREAPAQTAATSPRRHPAAPVVPAEAQPFAAAVVEAEAADEALPERLLPFAPTLAPTIRAVRRTVGFVGAQAAALRTEAVAIGGAVGDLVGDLR